jgi:UDP-N-acetyl-D-mannosaminuronic acid dehydrogenase
MTDRSIETVCVIGLGYIGLPTASVLASRGVRVIGVDVKPEVVETINRGEIHIVEPELEAVTAHAVQLGFLTATTEPRAADAFMIAVPTPWHAGMADLTYVEAATRTIAPHLCKGNLVVVESTCPPGTTEKVACLLAELRADLIFPTKDGDQCDVFVAYCPERVLPGRVLTELVENNRVIGGITAECSRRAQSLYSLFCKGALLTTTARTAEMCKLTENAFRDVNIAFANELSLVCERLGIDVWEMIKLANGHPRVNILQPGPCVGGHCIAVDPWFIVEAAPEEARIIRTAREINDGKPVWVLNKVREAIAQAGDGAKRAKIACLGLAFKPNVDDLRESPALQIAETLADWDSCDLLVCEPYINELPKSLAGRRGVSMVTDAADAVRRSDVVLLLVNHQPFAAVERTALIGKIVIDTRGMWA